MGKHTTDVGAALGALASVCHILPDILAAVASMLSVVWYSIRLWEYIKSKREVS